MSIKVSAVAISEVYIQSAKRTYYAYYIDSANVLGEASFLITDDATSWSGAVTKN